MLSKRNLIIALFMHTLFFIFAVAFLIYQHDKSVKDFLKEFYSTNKTNFYKTINNLNKNVDLLEKFLIDKKIISIIDSANRDISKREELIKLFMPKYKVLKDNGFYLVHFHLKGGISFVRFHKLNKYGDYLYDFRPALKYVQTTGKIFHGFEIGKGVGGFRSIYPLKVDNQIVGSVEISFSMQNLIDYMFEHERLALVIKKDILKNFVYESDLKNFKSCKLNSDYFSWGNIYSLFKKTYKMDFNKKINIIEKKVILSYPIYDFKNYKEGFIIAVIPINDIDILKEMDSSFEKMIVIATFVYISILLAILGLYYYFNLKVKAEVDFLTETFNRAGCDKKVKHLKNYSILIIDIDHFKKINDTYGHDIGDKILSEVAKLIKSSVREDDVICRWGGEEFVVILKRAKLLDAVNVAQKIKERVERENFDGVKVTVSIGVASFKESFKDAFKKADEKLYEAKKSGRNRVVF